jgi:Fe-S-cluster containining protein
MGRGNPCIQCGACCAFFRVTFFWEEANPENSDSVPVEMTEPVNDLLQCMKGTNQPHPRCAALSGEIGNNVGCKIYERRSSVCREFGLHEN